MHVASKELSEELYGLSGWDDTNSVYRLWNDGQTDFEWEKTEPIGRYGQYRMLPAYSLSYLLRRLREQNIFPIISAELYDKWWAKYGYLTADYKTLVSPAAEFGVGDTPEDATAKLCIELFKQKILTRES